MGEQPFIKFYPSDFLAGTSGLSPAERGVYITLLCLIYEHDGPIQRDDARLARRCGSPKAAFVRTLDGLIAEGKITQDEDVLSNRRAEKALMDRTNRTQNSTHAANQRWGAQGQKMQQKQREVDAGAMPSQCVGDASQKPEPDTRKRDTNVSLVQSDRFDEFWAAYPRKTVKSAARKAYAKAVKKARHDEIMFGLSRHLPALQAKEQQFIPHPATWLNQERWSDEPEQPDNNIQRRTMAGGEVSAGRGRGGGIAAAVARRQLSGGT